MVSAKNKLRQTQWIQNWFRCRCCCYCCSSMRGLLTCCSIIIFLTFIHTMKVINVLNPLEPAANCPVQPYAPLMVETAAAPPSEEVFWTRDNEAPCQFHHMDNWNYHFPHTMQQLYRCWSLWRNQSNPILIFPKNGLPENAFLQGYVGSLHETIKLSLQRTGVGNLPKVPNNTIKMEQVQWGGEIPAYAFERPDDAAQLRDLFLETQSCGRLPRVAILNRKRKREWTTAHEIRIQFEGEELLIRHQVFTDESFRQQIEFFHDTDILIGPHGAQLTGIPFMPDCGAVIELFSEYYLPHFFGSLATASQLSHGYIYMRTKDHTAMRSVRTRQKVRNCKLDPPPNIVESAIYTMIEKWQTCCRHRNGSVSS